MPELTEATFNEVSSFCRSTFRLGYFNIDNAGEKDSFAEDEQHYFDPNDEKHSEKEK
jgi:hypothetical protein